MPVSCPKLIYLYDLICHFSETFAKSAAFFHSIPPVVWIFWQMSIQFYLWRSLLKFLKSPSSSWDLRSSSSSSEVRQKFVRNSSSSSEVRQVRSSSKVRQVLQKFVKFVGGLGGGPNWESGQLIFLILMGKTSFVFWFFGWPNNLYILLLKNEIWRTWRTSDELDELLTNLTNFWRTWRTSDELLTNFWRTSDELDELLTCEKNMFLWVVVKSQPLAQVFCFFAVGLFENVTGIWQHAHALQEWSDCEPISSSSN